MVLVNEKTQSKWSPIFTIDGKNCECLFDKSRLPTDKSGLPASDQLGRDLQSRKWGTFSDVIRVQHHVPVSQIGGYNASEKMLQAAWDSVTEHRKFFESDSCFVFFHEVENEGKITETLELISQGVIKKAVFEIKGHNLGVVFHLNPQHQIISDGRFNLFACDFSIDDKIHVSFDSEQYFCGLRKGLEVVYWEVIEKDKGMKRVALTRSQANFSAFKILERRVLTDGSPLTIQELARIKALPE